MDSREQHEAVANCGSRASVRRAGEPWPACDCGLDRYGVADALVFAGVAEGESPAQCLRRVAAERNEERASTALHIKINQAVSDALGQHVGQSWHDLGAKVAGWKSRAESAEAEVARLTKELADAKAEALQQNNVWFRESESLSADLAEARRLLRDLICVGNHAADTNTVGSTELHEKACVSLTTECARIAAFLAAKPEEPAGKCATCGGERDLTIPPCPACSPRARA